MNKILSTLMVCFIAAAMLAISCKKTDPKDLEYLNITTNNYVQAYVKTNSGKLVMSIQVLDQIDDKAIVNSYKTATDKVGKYPARIGEDKWLWILVNNRIEIRLVSNDDARDFQDTDDLVTFIKRFDLEGMEKITGKKLKGIELKKFLPVLGGK